MTKTIAINAGSSSLKWQLFEMPEEKVIAKGLVDRIGIPGTTFVIKYADDQKFEVKQDMNDHKIAVELLLEKLISLKIVEDMEEITGVGHRVVAGGEYFNHSVVVDQDVMDKIGELEEYAPLHNPANLLGIKVFKELLPEATSVAVFDTAFHQTMPEKAYMYSLPYEYYEKYGARKYGAHGTSHQYVAQRAAAMLGKPIEETKIITCHLGNGASVTAVKGGISVDTSMGFTPLAGVTMSSRSGDIDASLVMFLMQKLNISDPNDMLNILNKKSGILGLSGVSTDMRDLEKTLTTNPRSRLGISVFADRVRKYIAQYVAVMNGCDAIVFTAGIGENDGKMRKRIIEGMSCFGCDVDDERNDVFGEERIISTDAAKIKVMMIPTDEEVMIARDVEALSK